MTGFYEQPILNSPYRPPALHHPLDEHGQPLEGPALDGRRPSRFIVPVPTSRKKPSGAQASLDLESYSENALINEIRQYLTAWRAIPNPADWGFHQPRSASSSTGAITTSSARAHFSARLKR